MYGITLCRQGVTDARLAKSLTLDALADIPPAGENLLRWTALRVRRRTGGLELIHALLIASVLRALQGQGIGLARILNRIDDLPGAHIRQKQIGTLLDHQQPDDRTPALTDQNDLRLFETRAQILRHLNTVLDQAIEIQRRRRSVARQRSARAALVPLRDDVIVLPGVKVWIRPGAGRVTRAAMQEEQYRTRSVLALNADPLINAANGYEAALIDGIAAFDRIHLR